METAHKEILEQYLPDNHMYIDRADDNAEDFNEAMNRHLLLRYNIDDEVRLDFYDQLTTIMKRYYLDSSNEFYNYWHKDGLVKEQVYYS